MELDHVHIIKLVANGDRVAFKKIYDLYSDRVYNVALSYTKNVHDAEEITQDVFIKIFNNASKFEARSALATWIYRVTVNVSINYMKKTKRRMIVAKHDLEFVEFEHPGTQEECKEDSKKLFAVINTLSENQRTAFILSYVENLSRQEVANVMEVSLKAVESLLSRAKKNLKTRLIKLYPNRRNG